MKKNYKGYLVNKLRGYKKEDIIISEHARSELYRDK